jgi:hypothetical protein
MEKLFKLNRRPFAFCCREQRLQIGKLPESGLFPGSITL